MSHMARPEVTGKRLLTRRQLAEFLTQHGFPISVSQLDKYAMVGRDDGPPIAGYWARYAMYDPAEALPWAERRLRANWRGKPAA
jgi:hypothetical protein